MGRGIDRHVTLFQSIDLLFQVSNPVQSCFPFQINLLVHISKDSKAMSIIKAHLAETLQLAGILLAAWVRGWESHI